MKLLFRPRDEKYVGSGNLPHGTFDDTAKWIPIFRYLEEGARKFPDKPLFTVGDSGGKAVSEYTYGSANGAVNTISNALLEEAGVNKGETVGIYMLNRAEFVLSILAIHKSGGVQVPINKDEKGERLAYIINYSGQRVLMTDEESLPLLGEIEGGLENLEYVFVAGGGGEKLPAKIGRAKVLPFSFFDDFSSENPDVDVSVSDAERCMFTSGTTGMPKGVSRNHSGVVLTVRAYIEHQGIRSEDALMTVLSLAHANAQVMCLFASIAAGARCVIFPRFSASNFWKWAGDCGATITNMLGSVPEYLWASARSEHDRKHSVRTVLAGPAPKNRTEFEERFGIRVVEGYGSTEMGMVLWQYAEDFRSGSSGFVTQGYHVEIRDSEDTDTVVQDEWDTVEHDSAPPQCVGLLFIRPLIPDTTLNEYFKDPERTRQAFDDEGFFNSDDLFARGTDGRYYFQGRYSRIRVSGENVDPNAVANTALKHEAVSQAIALGVRLPDISDDEIKLNIVLNAGASFDEVEFCKWMAERGPVYMVPRFIQIYEQFPLTSTQKINLGSLKLLEDKTWDRSKSGLRLKTRK
ncbi:MAG: AMP-binding protein [Candidatus Mycalebacterium zealandia]|nr:MAG: AMP-binding protein [Candidatus Mycalebacterium zealandia]